MALLVVAACVWASALGRGEEPAEELFREGAREAVVPQMRFSPAVKRARRVDLNPQLAGRRDSALHRPGGRFRLGLFGETPCTATVGEVEESPGGRWRSLGRLEGQPDSHVLLVGRGDAMAGTIFVPGTGVFQLQYAGTGGHRLAELDTENFPGCAVGAGSNVAGKPDLQETAASVLPESVPGAAASGAVSPQVVDLLAVYTEAARDAAGGEVGMGLLLDLACAEANLCYANSGVNLRLNLVHAEAVHYPEEGWLSQDLTRLLAKADGYLDEVHRLRTEYAADLVTLIVEQEYSGLYAGLASQMMQLTSDFSASAFSVVRRPYLTGNYTLVHELGHNMGCGHDRANNAGGALTSYASGYRLDVGGITYRTVMAYRPGRQIPYFSNPNLRFQGVPLGAPEGAANAADNARVLGLSGATVAGFLVSPARVRFAVETTIAAAGASSVSLSVQRAGDTNGPASVHYATADGTALAGVDYTAGSGVIDFPPGTRECVLTISLNTQRPAAETKAFSVRLTEPAGGLALNEPATAQVVLSANTPPAAGSLDLSYDPGSGADYRVDAIVLRPGGGAVIAGGFRRINGLTRPHVAALTGNGSVDASFGSSLEFKYGVRALVRQPDGCLLIGGEFNTVDSTNRNRLARLLPDGLLDVSFRAHPRENFSPTNGPNDTVFALALQPDGKVVAGGAFTAVNGTAAKCLARFLGDGTQDVAFSVGEGPDGPVYALALQPDGRLLVGGGFQSVQGQPRPGVARLETDGRLDGSFVPGNGWGGTVLALALPSDGGVLVGGTLTWTEGATPRNVIRLDAAGRLEPGLAVEGPDGPVHCLALQSDGRLVLGGAFSHVSGLPRHNLARVHPDGSLDASFNAGSGPNGDVYALAVQPDGDLLIGGLFATVDGQPRAGIARLMAQGDNSPGRIWLRAEPSFPGEGMRLSTTNTPGKTYILEVSTDLRGWLPVFTNRPAGFSFDHQDREAAGMDWRFYRARNAGQPAPP